MAKQRYVWDEGQPIYRQITEVLITRILDGAYPEGELLPSVRQVADEFSVSPLTAAKVFQELDKDNLTVKRRGIGTEVRPGARERMIKQERERFLKKEWPELRVRLNRLDIDLRELFGSDG
ncbi:MAG: GntR family transcriptional regulator [Myxococcota bacterium]